MICFMHILKSQAVCGSTIDSSEHATTEDDHYRNAQALHAAKVIVQADIVIVGSKLLTMVANLHLTVKVSA